MKLIFALLLLLFSNVLFGQQVLKGIVTNEQNIPVPGVRVFIENTTYGVITDFKGFYFLELPVKKTYPIAFKMIGMKDSIVEIDITQKITNFKGRI